MTESEYQAQMEVAYKCQQQEREALLQKYWPVHPFFGEWVSAAYCDPEVIAKAYHLQAYIDRNSDKFSRSQIVVQSFSSPLAKMPLIRVNEKWLKQRKSHIEAMTKLAKALAESNGESEEAIEPVWKLCEEDDQLLAYFNEVFDAFEELQSDLPSAEVGEPS